MTKSEIEAAIDEQAAEIGLDLGMKRDAFHDLPCEKKFATIVTGVRRCGKSTLLGQWAHSSGLRVVSVLFDDLRLMNFTPSDFVLLGKIISERKPQAIALDEIQDIDGWELFVNGLLNRGYAVFVTGSNAKMLSRELGTKLTGRHLDLQLQPFSYSEFIRFKGLERKGESIDEYLRTGGFPAYVASGNRQVLVELFNDIIYRDIVVRYNIANTAPIKQLAGYLLAHIGTRMAPSRLKDAIRVQSAKTVLEYFDHLTECCLIRRLEQYSGSPKARMLAHKKVYACDVALASLFDRGNQINLGHKLENVLFWHLRRKARDVTYHVDDKGRECDFVVEGEDGAFSAVQVCYELTDDNMTREFDGLAAAARRFGLKSGVIVTCRQSDEAIHDGCEISVVPAADYLSA
ncbi:MAG: ATP-binding protein [Kiritimatiellae bacterium]|nr:ATP-binding protein [Kiritimatiellia bacterium]